MPSLTGTLVAWAVASWGAYTRHCYVALLRDVYTAKGLPAPRIRLALFCAGWPLLILPLTRVPFLHLYAWLDDTVEALTKGKE